MTIRENELTEAQLEIVPEVYRFIRLHQNMKPKALADKLKTMFDGEDLAVVMRYLAEKN